MLDGILAIGMPSLEDGNEVGRTTNSRTGDSVYGAGTLGPRIVAEVGRSDRARLLDGVRAAGTVGLGVGDED